MIKVKLFSAEWCQPCKVLKPIMNEIVSEMDDIEYTQIDIDAEPDEAENYGVRSIPTLVFERDGAEVERLVGLMPKKTLVDKINGIK